MLRQAMHQLSVQTRGQGFRDITAPVQAWLREIDAREGLVTVFMPHTSASLTIQENTDPDVLADLQDALERWAPRGATYRHRLEGPDDMPAHIKAMVTQTSIAVPVRDGRAAFGTWQALYLIEHRDRPHARQVMLHYMGS